MNFRDNPRVTRKYAAQLFGCTIQNVRKMQARGVLRSARIEKDGGVTYERDEIQRVAAERRQIRANSGADNAVRAFELFKQGMEHADVVTTLCLDPDYVVDLFEKYRRGYARETSEERDAREKREREAQEAAHHARMLALDRSLFGDVIGVEENERSTSTSPPTQATANASEIDAFKDHEAFLAKLTATSSRGDDPLIQRVEAVIARGRKLRGGDDDDEK